VDEGGAVVDNGAFLAPLPPGCSGNLEGELGGKGGGGASGGYVGGVEGDAAEIWRANLAARGGGRKGGVR
jgi:hypothetical protein